MGDCIVEKINGIYNNDNINRFGEVCFDINENAGTSSWTWFNVVGVNASVRTIGIEITWHSSTSDTIKAGTLDGNAGKLFIGNRYNWTSIQVNPPTNTVFTEELFKYSQSLTKIYISRAYKGSIDLDKLISYCPSLREIRFDNSVCSGDLSKIPGNTTCYMKASDVIWTGRDHSLPRLKTIAEILDFGDYLPQMLIDMAACSGDCERINVRGNLSGSSEETAAINTLKSVVSGAFIINNVDQKV